MKKLTNFSRRERLIICVAMGVVSIFLFERFFFSGIRLKIRTTAAQIKMKELELSRAINIRNRKEKIEEDYQVYKSYLKGPGASDIDMVTDFLKELEDITRRSGVSVVNLTPANQAREVGGYKRFYAELRIETSFEELFNFLNEVQNNRLLIKIDRLNITAKDETTGALRADIAVSMTAL